MTDDPSSPEGCRIGRYASLAEALEALRGQKGEA
jgi:hypothetical protein